MEEIWKPILDLDSYYDVSNLGRIRNHKTGHIKSLVFDGHYYKFGYDYSINKNRKRGWYRVHQAVAKAFIPNPENKPTVNHKDGIKEHNYVSNLEWSTHKEQSVHATTVLYRNCGENNYNAKHKNSDVIEMRRLFESGNKTVEELAVLYNDSIKNIRRIVKYERWKNVK